MRKLFRLVAGVALAVMNLPAEARTREIALSGATAPSGGTFNSFGAGATVGGLGVVAFPATLSGGTSPNGIFITNPGEQVQTLALEGTTYPTSGVISGLSLSVNGKAAFLVTLPSGSESLYAGTPGNVASVAVSGAASSAGGIFNVIGTPAVNAYGQVSFQSSLLNASAASGIFLAAAAGSPQSVALQGSPAAGLTTNNYTSLDTSPKLNDAGQLAFMANLSSVSVPQAIFVGTPGSLQPIAYGSAAPGGGTFGSFASPALSADGYVAFVAGVDNGPSSGGLFVGKPGALQAVARTGAVVPGGGAANITFSDFSTTPALSSGQNVVFSARTLNNTTHSFSSGIFAGLYPNPLYAVALEGGAAPGGGNFDSLLNATPLMNSYRQVAFVAKLTGSGFTSANNTALFAGSAYGLSEIVRTGDVIDVNPGSGVDDRTVAPDGIGFLAIPGSEDGRGIGLSQAQEFAYTLTFTGGSSAVFLVDLPEPSGMLLVIGLVVGAAPRRRRNRQA